MKVKMSLVCYLKQTFTCALPVVRYSPILAHSVSRNMTFLERFPTRKLSMMHLCFCRRADVYSSVNNTGNGRRLNSKLQTPSTIRALERLWSIGTHGVHTASYLFSCFFPTTLRQQKGSSSRWKRYQLGMNNHWYFQTEYSILYQQSCTSE